MSHTKLPCVICGTQNKTSKSLTTTFDEVELLLAICKKCGHCYQCPQMSKEYAADFYDEAYGEEPSKYEYFHQEKKLAHAQEMFGVFRAHCPNAFRILEIGAGAGEFAYVAEQAGCTVLGTESSRAAIARAKQRYGIELLDGSIQEIKADPFDAVVMWDVIEHCPNAEELMAEISEKLKPGGTLVFTTGNYECAKRLGSGSSWWCWQGDHYHYFRPSGLKQLGKRFGLDDFSYGPVPRLKHSSAASRPAKRQRRRFLNPVHVARVIRYRVLEVIAKLIWPDRWNMEIGLFKMTKTMSTDSERHHSERHHSERASVKQHDLGTSKT